MDNLDLHLALEALRTNPATHAYHERITRGMQAIEQGTLTPFERDALHRLLARFPPSTPAADPVAALIAAFQHELPQHDPSALATAIQHALAQRPVTLNGAPVTITMNGDTYAHQANLAIGNQVGGNLVQVTVTIPIPDARFDALLASALRTHEQEKTLARIQHAAQQIESDRLLNLRLQGFVGRINELAAIREQIAAMRPTGGYVLIKAAAGEGKSSSIAKLIQEAGIAATPHHFTALTTDRAYQLGLLRAVVAQLILKHNLTVSYFPEESYPAMKGEFARILDELAKQGIHETIYLDGLDQLQPEIDGSRDLSFLPPQPPPSIVIVLGSRPDETLKPLEILHRVDYALPPLSEPDALELWRSVQPGVADGLFHDLYRALKGNALFVHLAANTMRDQSMVDATSLIQQIEQNPQNLFGITLERIKGRSMADWRSIWKPMLTLLLVAQEPLRLDVLGDLLEHDHDTMQDAVWVLGGLVSQGIDQRVALHHLLFRDYLIASVFNQREVKRWQQRLADWCAVDLDTIWADHPDVVEQARRVYARHHYITHLALAENWTTLWQVLDAGDYGEQKTRFDPSTRLYALDLDRGRESAIQAGKSTEEYIQHLPRLWKYSLLRTSLASRIDRWIDPMFIVLAKLDRTHEAIERIDQLSNPMKQVKLWSKIITWCNTNQRTRILQRMYQSLRIAEPLNYIHILINIAQAYESINKYEQVIVVVEQALSLINTIPHIERRIEALTNIAEIYASINKYEDASMVLKQCKFLIETIDNEKDRNKALIFVAKTYVSLGNIDEALSIVNAIITAEGQAYIIASIAIVHVSVGNIEQADMDLTKASRIAYSIDDTWGVSFDARAVIATGYAAINKFDQAINIAQSIQDPWFQAEALFGIALAYISIGNFDQAINIAQSIQDNWLHAITFATIAAKAKSNGNIEQATEYFSQAARVIHVADNYLFRVNSLKQIVEAAITTINSRQAIILLDYIFSAAQSIDELEDRVIVFLDIANDYRIIGHDKQSIYILEQADNIINSIHGKNAAFACFIVQAYISQGNIERAIAIAETIDDPEQNARALVALVQAYISQGNIEHAITIAETIDDPEYYDTALVALVQAYISQGNIEHAITIAETIDDPKQNACALIALVQAYISQGNIEHAITIAETIDDPKQNAYALIALAQAYITINKKDQSEGLLEKATQVTLKIEDLHQRVVILSTIADTTTLAGNPSRATLIFETAMAIASSEIGSSNMTEALIAISEKYQNNHERVIIMIRDTWHDIKSDDDLWFVLPLINPLVKTNPWLVDYILEGDAWVNEQLKRLG